MDMQTEAIRNLTREIPLNDFGLPTGIYRVDLLPFHEYQDEQTLALTHDPNLDPNLDPEMGEATKSISLVDFDAHRHTDDYRIAGFPARSLHQAFMPLQYDEGFPALDTGLPFWSRLEFEPAEAYEAFQKYLQMNLGSPGSHGGDIDDDYDGREARGTRSLSALVGEQFGDQDLNRMAQLYQEYYHMYYWGLRAHSYDLFRVAQYRKQQELRSIETQGEHYHISRRMRHRLMKYMDSEEEFWDLMSPKVAMDMLKTLTQLERISAGLPAAGPATADSEGRSGAPFEVMLRTVAQGNRRGGERTITEDGEMLDMALEDANATGVLQELIIRAGG